MGAYELAVVGLVGSGVGAALGTPLVWPGHTRRGEVRLLGSGVLAVSALAAVISARLVGLVPASAGVGHLVNVLGLVAFPLGVAYVRLSTGARRPGTPWLVAPLTTYVTVAVARSLATGQPDVPFPWLLPVVLAFTSVAAHSVWRGRASPDALVPPAWMVGFMALVNVAQIARMDLGHVPAARAAVPLVLGLGFVAMVALVMWRQVDNRPGEAVAVPAVADEPRYERSTLDDGAARELLSRVDRALQQDRLFARLDLTLAALAQAAGSTPHHVSEALNRVGGTSFRDLVTRRRVDDVKSQLRDPANDRYTIEGIGVSAGFRARSALYDAFRRLEHTTPTAYRDRVRQRGGAGDAQPR